MSQLSEILAFNDQFVAARAYEEYRTDRFPGKKLVVVTCMDTRLTELLPKAGNLLNIRKVAAFRVRAPGFRRGAFGGVGVA